MIDEQLSYAKLNLKKQDNLKDYMRLISKDYDFAVPIPPILILKRFLRLLIVSFPKSIISH